MKRNGKINKNFQKIKKLKDSGKSGDEIAKELDINNGSVQWVFSAINSGFDSLNEYRNQLIANKINPETGKSFSSSNEYDNYRSRQNGFKSPSEYAEFRKLVRSDEDKPTKIKQRDFENSIGLVPLESFVNLLSDNEEYNKRIEQKDHLDRLLQQIPDRWKLILEMRYYEKRTLKEIGNILDISREKVRQLEERAINHLRLGKSKVKIKQSKKIDDGELLLSYILSKSIQDWNKSSINKGKRIKRFINQHYHDGEEVRGDSIASIIYKKNYKQRLEKIREKYIPLNR